MSKYAVNKFLFQVDRDPGLLAAYKADPEAMVARWERDYAPYLGAWNQTVERSTVVQLTDDERRALVEHDYVALFEMGAHYFLTLTIFIGIYEEDYVARVGPLSFQKEYREKLAHWIGRPYPSVAL
ncbi:hypothetical protein GCM10011490_14050 [Pseudoclavibacter endophyticus]|uniref:Extradiol ring-cleavage dioxygenase LigAB LigA subunit domain-containing protein n=1 Tax=Pseudoclavibacter endophyticus TaxID=1778590 RepID=A0A6H9WMF7_9MICO|nr:hypothetical protein [Pseudoclavibacter endophyticus]KAB1649198.1 hypothetical protein F8O04_02655 [Pseudoclavibacter endophyticus]GGA64614.1 hypothetical protein GCM10011490_14050 [Pseudoclavibacter endophyticus]